jgi:N-dimethylarginine dimethylaminohydrolase
MNKIIRVLIKPSTFNIFKYQKNQNPYIDINHNILKNNVMTQHSNLAKSISKKIIFEIQDVKHNLPDIVFVANSGLCLPRIPNTIILPNMKYKQRREELEYLEKIFRTIRLNPIRFPGNDLAPFEGQAEVKWFHNGNKLICGYGFRSTKETFEILKSLLNKLYKSHSLNPPELLVLPLESPNYYHLDLAMLEYDDSKCIIHEQAFNKDSIEKIKDFLGEKNVTIINTNDKMCLNAIVDGNKLLTHKIKDNYMKIMLENIVKRKIKEIDTSEFEKSGGSVRCMTLDMYI